MKFGNLVAFLVANLGFFALETNAYEDNNRLQIVSKMKAEIGRYEYYVQTVPIDYCGGFLIAPNVVLSAAHCENEFTVEVRIGSYKNSIGGEKVGIKEIIVHPDYNAQNLENDYMLVVLQRDSKYSPVIIADTEYDATLAPGTSLYAIGLAYKKYGGLSEVRRLREVHLPYIDNEQCERQYNHIGWPFDDGFDDNINDDTFKIEIADSMMCTATEEKRDSCQGDNGGPLIRRGADAAEDIVVGIVSWGFYCGKYPSVYSRVGEEYEWIKAVVEENKGQLASHMSPPHPNYEYIGCYRDNEDDNVFSYRAKRRNASIEQCASLCQGNKYFYRKGKGTCFCGNDDGYDRHGKSDKCECEGDDVGENIGCIYKLQALSEGCYDETRNFIPGCSCHSSCKVCGYEDDPTYADNCTSCVDGIDVIPTRIDGTGTCGTTI